MGKIIVYEKDYKVENDEGKVFGVYKNTILNFKQHNISLNYTHDDVYKNSFLDLLYYYYNNPFILKYLDATYGIDKTIKFEIYTFIGEKDYLITPELISELQKKGGKYEIYLYLGDSENNFLFQIGYIKMYLSYNPPGIFSSGYEKINIEGDIYLDGDLFIKSISKKYFGRSNGSEDFIIN